MLRILRMLTIALFITCLNGRKICLSFNERKIFCILEILFVPFIEFTGVHQNVEFKLISFFRKNVFKALKFWNVGRVCIDGEHF